MNSKINLRKKILIAGLLIIISVATHFYSLFTESSQIAIWALIILSNLGLLIALTYISRDYIKLLTQYSSIIDSAHALPHGMFVLSRHNKMLFRNKAYNLFFHENIMREDNSHLFADVIRRARMGRTAQEILPVKDSKGNSLIYRITAANLENNPGELAFSIADITQVSTENEGSTFLHSVIDSSPIGVFSIDHNGHFLFINKSMKEWFKKISPSVKNLFRLLDNPDDRNALFPPQRSFSTQKTYENRITIGKKNYKILQKFIKKEDGDFITCSIMLQAKNRTQTKDIKLEMYKNVFDEAPSGIVVLDQKQNILSANQLFGKMVHKDLEDLVYRHFSNLLSFKCKDMVIRRLDKIIEKELFPDPVEISFKGSPEEDLSVYMSPLKVEEEVTGIIMHFFNTKEQKKMEIQFVHSQRMQAVGQLAGGVAHDFNNLLTAMIGFCDLLLERHSPAEQSFSDIIQIKQNANRAAVLVKQLLAFSRQQSLQPKVLNVTDAISEISLLLRRLLGPSIELKVKHQRDLWFVKVDKGQLEQVIINLAVNARDAMESNGYLRIEASNFKNQKDLIQHHDTLPAGDYVQIEVEDTGCGMAPEIIDRIFEPFFSTKEIGSGTGLGLSTVYGIVRQTGGFIFVDSAVKKGTTFKIFLPRHIVKRGEEVQIIEEKHAKDLTGTARILLVEDEDAVRMFGARALKDKGYEVIEAASGAEALELIKEQKPQIDLIITDVVMPQMDGPQMINEIRKLHPDMRVIFISGYAEDSFRKKLDTEDNIHFLPKPFNLKDLAIKVKDILE